MNLSKFLDFNKHCPVCGESLTLYLQVSEGPLWRAKTTKAGDIYFKLIKGDATTVEPESFVHLVNHLDNFDVYFSDKKVMNQFNDWSFFFYYMCNEDAIEDKPYNTWVINPYVGCYVRSSPYVRFAVNEKDEWELTRSKDKNEDDQDGLFDLPPSQTRDEICIFKVQSHDLEKIYALDFDYQTAHTILRYYATTAAERQIVDFEPKVFKKELPMLGARPNFELARRPELISRLDSWILMS